MYLNQIKKLVENVDCIILDIEGTTTSLDFVKKELFPYAEKNLEEYIKSHWNKDKVKEIVGILIKEQGILEQIEGFVPLSTTPLSPTGTECFQDAVIRHLMWQMAHDCKTTGLKKLQGYVWKNGYDVGLLQGHIYEDVPIALEHWKQLGKKIYIYSSGSVEAQKLLFNHSIFGNLDEFISGNFDTTTGSKIDRESYSKIAKEINEDAKNIVFFTDRPKGDVNICINILLLDNSSITEEIQNIIELASFGILSSCCQGKWYVCDNGGSRT